MIFHECYSVENRFRTNETSTTGERKMSDFYTIFSGCPQISPIYPLFIDFLTFFFVNKLDAGNIRICLTGLDTFALE